MNQLDDMKPTEPQEVKKKSSIWAFSVEELNFPILLGTIYWLGVLYYDGEDKIRVPILAIIAGIAVFLLVNNFYIGLLRKPNNKQTLLTTTILIISVFAVLFFPKVNSFINGVMTSGLVSQLPYEFKSWYIYDLIKFAGFNFMLIYWLPIEVIRHLSHVFKIIDGKEDFEYYEDEMFQFSSVASLTVFCIHFIINEFPL